MPIDRRAAFGSLAAAGAMLLAPRVAKAAPLPSLGFETAADARIFDLVAEDEHWWSQISTIGDIAENTALYPDADAELAEVFDRYRDAFEEMLTTPRQTPAGARAKLEWVKKDCDEVIPA